MKTGYVLLGAAALVGIAGALAGAAIGTSPMMRDSTGSELPEAPIVTAGNHGLRTTQTTPDHYAVITPDGRIEAGEIALRGQMRKARTRPMPPGYDFDPQTDRQHYSEAEMSRLASEEALIAYTSRPPAPALASPTLPGYQEQAAEPGAGLADPVVEPIRQTIGNAKVVDVNAALAERD